MFGETFFVRQKANILEISHFGPKNCLFPCFSHLFFITRHYLTLLTEINPHLQNARHSGPNTAGWFLILPPNSLTSGVWSRHSLWELYTIASNFQSSSGECLRRNHKIHQLGLNNLQSRNWTYFSLDRLISTFQNTNLSGLNFEMERPAREPWLTPPFQN